MNDQSGQAVDAPRVRYEKTDPLPRISRPKTLVWIIAAAKIYLTDSLFYQLLGHMRCKSGPWGQRFFSLIMGHLHDGRTSMPNNPELRCNRLFTAPT